MDRRFFPDIGLGLIACPRIINGMLVMVLGDEVDLGGGFLGYPLSRTTLLVFGVGGMVGEETTLLPHHIIHRGTFALLSSAACRLHPPNQFQCPIC